MINSPGKSLWGIIFIDVILYENPSTQDEIAERLGITRRYVTKLLRPLIRKGVVKRAYMVDLQRFEEFSDIFGEELTSREFTPFRVG